MLELLSRHCWALVLRGVAAVLFGLMALIWPSITLAVLVLLWGAYVLVDGVFALGVLEIVLAIRLRSKGARTGAERTGPA
jgi:uncharacterized membrane protein HdeD (DUF308 family)